MKQRISPAVAIVVLVVAMAICGISYILTANQSPPPPPPGSAKPIDQSGDSTDIGGLRKKGAAPPAGKAKDSAPKGAKS